MTPDPDDPRLFDPAKQAAAKAHLLEQKRRVVSKAKALDDAANAAKARPAAGDPSALDRSVRTALLHWCDSANIRTVVDQTPVLVGKKVKMRAEPLAGSGYGGSATFAVHQDMGLVRRILARLHRQRHPMPPFGTTTKASGLIVSRDSWPASVSRFSGQGRHYFTDEDGQESGLLVVTRTSYGVTETSAMLNKIEVPLAPGAAITANGAFGRKGTKHKVYASKDPRLKAELLTPGQDGNLSLIAHVRNLVEETIELIRDENRGDEPGPPIELTDTILMEAAGGYLNPDGFGLVQITPDTREITVDEGQPAHVDVEIQPGEAAGTEFQTSYALRLTNADDPDDFVISGIVMIDGQGDTVRIQI
ncbi:hypothetical protein [Catenulispora rubra]|uniref:hypothetical protein n=1 Tax=Catenulispora rubra TaxID=280293 RepID=UPI0018925F33|nr:hypothetical protein [Catenulispora rubra]